MSGTLIENGAVARTGRVLQEVVATGLERRRTSLPRRRSLAGVSSLERRLFRALLRCAGRPIGEADRDDDVIATATALDGWLRLLMLTGDLLPGIWMRRLRWQVEFVVAGGGAKNYTLMGMLRNGLEPLG